MQPQPHGNGSSKVAIHNVDMGGWVRVHTDKLSVVPDDLALFLSHALSEWFRQRPQLTMRCVTPVVRDGYTVELHAGTICTSSPIRAGRSHRSYDSRGAMSWMDQRRSRFDATAALGLVEVVERRGQAAIELGGEREPDGRSWFPRRRVDFHPGFLILGSVGQHLQIHFVPFMPWCRLDGSSAIKRLILPGLGQIRGAYYR